MFIEVANSTIFDVTDQTRKINIIDRITGLFGRGAALSQDKARLEAFLDAVPGEYCGWAPDGTIAFSEGFCKLLALDTVAHIHDVQNALSPSDAAVLEGLYERLQNDGDPFSVIVRDSAKKKYLRLSGGRGRDPEGVQQFDILWLDDITAERRALSEAEDGREIAEQERDRLQAALDHFPVPVWMRDGRTELVWCNRAYAQALDSSPATVLAEQRELPAKPQKKSAAAPRPIGRLLAQAALDSGQKEHSTAHIILSGKRRLCTLQEIPLPGRDMTLGMAFDRTAEEEFETELNRYKTANNELLEQLGTAIGIFNADHRLEFYNSAFAQLWSLEDPYLNTRPKLGDMMEKLRETRHLPEQADFRKFKQSWLNMFTSLIDPHEDMLYLPNNTALRMLCVPHPMGGLMMTFEDVTSRLELESSYNTLIAVQKETLDNLSEGVAVFGGDGRLKLWNPSYTQLWGIHPEDVESEPHISRLVDKMKGRFEADKWAQTRETLIAQGIDRSMQQGRLNCSDGALIAYSTMPLPDGGMLVTHIDVTDTVRVENALREKNAALETAERLKLDFLANVSYQLRTPLSAMMGFAEILDKEYFGPLNERQKEYTAGMQDAGERLVSLVNDILDLATIEAGYMALQRESVSVHSILEALHNLTSEWARKEKIEVRLQCPKNIGKIEADERRLKQVLLNLIRNAITHTPERGTITLGARKDGDCVTLYVSDTGPGIPPEDHERIFEPFERTNAGQQGQNGNRTNRGAGLGLTLVRNIAEMHGGTVTLDSQKGKGTTVSLHLPK